MNIVHQQNIVCSFYQFLKIINLYDLKTKIFNQAKRNKILGTILIAKEGINGSISGKNESVKKITKLLQREVSGNILFKYSKNEKQPFLRLKVKIKKEIVRLGIKGLKPNLTTGKYVSPKEWDKFITNEDVIILDTRNNYETEIGSFKESIIPKTKTFSEFPNWIKQNKEILKNKKIAMYCTGGIRCEKASSYLLDIGYEDVFQLEGGVLNYLKEVKNKKKWKGECFVFDERVSVNDKLEKGNFIQCYACRNPLSKKDRLSGSYIKGVSCPKCYNKTSSKKKKSFLERQKQISLSKERGEKHIGNKKQ